MNKIDFTDNAFVVNGTSSTDVTRALQQSGLSAPAVAEVVGAWLIGMTGQTVPIPFRFTTDLENVPPACTETYARSFVHTDWVDGESRVQAGMTPEELGVNARFHMIENEFDAIASQFGNVAACISELRTDLIGIAGELETKITSMQNDIGGFDVDTTPNTPGGGIDMDIPTGDTDVQPPPGGPTVPKDTGPAGPDEDDLPELETDPLDEEGPAGPENLPGSGGLPEWKRGSPDEVMEFVTGLERTFAEPPITALFAEGESVSVATLRQASSGLGVPLGQVLRSLLVSLPARATFTSPNDAVRTITDFLVHELPKKKASALKRAVLAPEAVDRNGDELLRSWITVLDIDINTARALNDAGFGTIGKLAAASTSDIAAALAAVGLDADLAGPFFVQAILGSAVRNVG